MNLRALIVDDEALARERLRRLLSEIPGVEILGECVDGTSAISAIPKLHPDVVFLDVQMPGMDGFAVAKALNNPAATEIPLIVFVTGFDQYAVRAFEARALDYLLKPTSKTRLVETVRRIRERLKTTLPSAKYLLSEALQDLLAEREKTVPAVSRIAVRSNEGIVFVPLDELDWVEAAGNYAILHSGKNTHILRETMSALETQLPDDIFMRISRSAIVNLRKTRGIQTLAPGDHILLLDSGHSLPITRSLREIEDRLRFV
ncbi:MAG: LytTR family DNA-binding domain-containing protein [Puniceicoccales bacterium]|jgi:two-component system LytT family response regulator|nr:LytTR family DNA-binding domain-containing protein [Puniceicoccales bacterium]